MKIALVTEGTYPFAFGGVSVWCDQLIRGMPGYEFHVVAITATPGEAAVWALPGNVASVTTMPLWGPAPARPAGRHGRLPPRLLAELVDVLLGVPADTQHRFGGVLRELHEYCSRRGRGPWPAHRAARRRRTPALAAPPRAGVGCDHEQPARRHHRPGTAGGI